MDSCECHVSNLESTRVGNCIGVASGGLEDCFIVARNSRSAARFDALSCGFEISSTLVEKIAPIPPNIAKRFALRRRSDSEIRVGPGYADAILLERMGAERRVIEGRSETLINDIVYTTDASQTIMPRPVGTEALEKFDLQSWV